MSSTPLSTPPESAAEMFTVAAALGGAAAAVVVAATTDVAEATTASSARYANLRFITESLLSRGRSERPRFANLLASAFSPVCRTFKLSNNKGGAFRSALLAGPRRDAPPLGWYADRSTTQGRRSQRARSSAVRTTPIGDAHAADAWEAQRAQANGARHAEDRRSNRAHVASRLAAHASRRVLCRRARERRFERAVR